MVKGSCWSSAKYKSTVQYGFIALGARSREVDMTQVRGFP